MAVQVSAEYDMLLDLLERRMSVRRLRPDPLPDGAVERIVEAGRWAMSGANAQPWEFIIVRDQQIKDELFHIYREDVDEYSFWMEQQRVEGLRHPAFQVQGDPEEQLRRLKARPGWSQAPALIVVLGDGRRQWATVMGGHTFGRYQSHFTDGLANCCTLMHLAAAAQGLGTQWNTVHIEEPFKRVLGVPDLLKLFLIVPVGYADVDPKPGVRRPLADLLHYDRYDMGKFMSNKQVLDYLYALRGATAPKYLKAPDAGSE